MQQRTPMLKFDFNKVGLLDSEIVKVNLKVYDVTNWIANNYNAHITRYLKK